MEKNSWQVDQWDWVENGRISRQWKTLPKGTYAAAFRPHIRSYGVNGEKLLSNKQALWSNEFTVQVK